MFSSVLVSFEGGSVDDGAETSSMEAMGWRRSKSDSSSPEEKREEEGMVARERSIDQWIISRTSLSPFF
jgi:hypothetical protein